MAFMLKSVVLALATGASAQLSAVSWGENRGDIFGSFSQRLFHKFYTGHDWQPQNAEILAGSEPPSVFGAPSAVSWGEKRLDVFYSGLTDKKAYHRYFDGSGWQPDLKSSFGEDLGGPIAGKIAATTGGEGLIDLVAVGPNHDCLHRYLSGNDWHPAGGFESLGGNFALELATVRIGVQLHIFGVDRESSTLKHLYWNGDAWIGWEDLGGGPLAGPLSASSWSETHRFDVWATGKDGTLKHLYFQTDAYSSWESLGGSDLVVAPSVASQRVGAFDLIAAKPSASGKGLVYLSKVYDGKQWLPGVDTWWEHTATTFAGAPAALSWSSTTVALFGITSDPDSSLAFRYWWGNGWFPEDGSWHPLANLTAANEATDLPKLVEHEVLRSQELRRQLSSKRSR